MDVRVKADNEEMLNLALGHLKTRGVEDVGVMWMDWHNPASVQAARIGHFQDIIRQHGLKTSLDWILGVPEASEWQAYHAFNHIWELPHRPKGLLLLDEVFGRGALMATQSREIHVPEEMEMVVASYEDSPITFPASWNRCEINLGGCGARTALLLCELMEGKKIAGDIHLPFTWHDGMSGTDDPISPGFRSGRQILARVSEESVGGSGVGNIAPLKTKYRPVFGRTFQRRVSDDQ
jgi:DNA-binding LacI/PurR family transcriptional regulator